MEASKKDNILDLNILDLTKLLLLSIFPKNTLIGQLTKKIFQKNLTKLLQEFTVLDKELAKNLTDSANQVLNATVNKDVIQLCNHFYDALVTLFQKEHLALILTLTELILDPELNQKVQDVINLQERQNRKQIIIEIIDKVCEPKIADKIKELLQVENLMDLATEENIRLVLEQDQHSDDLAKKLSQLIRSKTTKERFELIADQNFTKQILTVLFSMLKIKVENTDQLAKLIAEIADNYPKEEGDQLQKERTKIIKTLLLAILKQLQDGDALNIISALFSNLAQQKEQLLPNSDNISCLVDFVLQFIRRDANQNRLKLFTDKRFIRTALRSLSKKSLIEKLLRATCKKLDIEEKELEKKAELIANVIGILSEEINKNQTEAEESTSVITGGLENAKAKITELLLRDNNLKTLIGLIQDFVKTKETEQQQKFLQDLELQQEQNNLRDILHKLLQNSDWQELLPAVAIKPIEYLITDQTEDRTNQVKKEQKKELVEEAKKLRKQIDKLLPLIASIPKNDDQLAEITELQNLLNLEFLSSPATKSKSLPNDFKKFARFIMLSRFSLEKMLKTANLDNITVNETKVNFTQLILNYHQKVSQLCGERLVTIVPILLQEHSDRNSEKQAKEYVQKTIDDILSIHNSKWAGKFVRAITGKNTGKVVNFITRKQQRQSISKEGSLAKKIESSTADTLMEKYFFGNFIGILQQVPQTLKRENTLYEKILIIAKAEQPSSPTKETDKNRPRIRAFQSERNFNQEAELSGSSNDNINNPKLRRAKSLNDIRNINPNQEEIVVTSKKTKNTANLSPKTSVQKPKTNITIVYNKTSVKPYVLSLLLLISSVTMFIIEHFKNNQVLLYAGLVISAVGLITSLATGIFDLTRRKPQISVNKHQEQLNL
ncbi:MAG: hypothetical protein HRK26_02465 [Rickettsiaceae bacterium H1]|nr:hypothetical protein [Rickettsiaceae bacterium H1]